MFSRLTFAVGFGAGYVLGARAGKDRYTQIETKFRELAGVPAVQNATTQVKATAADLADTANATAGDLADTAKATAGDLADTAKAKAADTVDAVGSKVGPATTPAAQPIIDLSAPAAVKTASQPTQPKPVVPRDGAAASASAPDVLRP